MNSPSHKANLIDTAFTEVGFGFANSANFVGTGNETIVVAHYAKPVSATPPPAPVAAAPAPKQSAPQAAAAVNEPAPAPEEIPIEIKEDTVVENKPAEQETNLPTNTDTVVPAMADTQTITRLQGLTGGKAPWSAVALSIIALSLAGFWIFKHALTVRKIFIEGEHFVAHHPIFDVLVVSVIALAVYLSQASGVIL
jgi:hypothetical protein